MQLEVGRLGVGRLGVGRLGVGRQAVAALALGVVTAGAVALGGGSASAAGPTLSLVRVNLGGLGAQANDGIVDTPAISADGRYVAFASGATNLVANDTNDYIDIFVRDRLTNITRRVNVSLAGRQANGASFAPVISANGRWVAYDSYASNLTAGDRNSASGGSDVFLYDMVTRSTARVSVPNGGGSANGESAFASISAGGRYVAYDSTARNLVGGDRNSRGDVFVWDRLTRRAVRASVSGSEKQADAGSGFASISADGRRVAFVSAAGNLVPGDTNGYNDVFVRDLAAGTTVRASVTADGGQGQDHAEDPVLSADGTHVAYNTGWRMSPADTDWTQDVYLRNLGARTTRMVSGARAGAAADDARGDSYGATISRTGRYVAFTSFADDLLLGDLNGTQEVYRRDMMTGALTRLAVNAAGTAGSASSYGPAITPDGVRVAFGASAPNLVRRDTNSSDDVFVVEPRGSYPVDVTAPRTAITSGPAGTVRSRTVSFTFTSDERGSAFQCRFDGGAWKACGSALTRSALAKGGHTLAVRAIDRAGNIDATPARRIFTIA